jgi:TPP-dependent pyruvate/acetoin dehydrogenase alpha subunit
VGGLDRSLGQEATAVGSAYALEQRDWVAPAIRDLGAVLVRGVNPKEILRQYTARSTSLTCGRDNTNHFTIPSLGLLGPIGPLGTQLCVLSGIALSFRLRGQRAVCLGYQGEGGTRTGAAHEGLSLAAALDLPMVVILEHNRWSFGTPSSLEAAVQDWVDVAAAYGIPAVSVDGNDVLAVHDATCGAVDRARAGHGMTLIVAETCRMLGHGQHDGQAIVPEKELERWRARDPLRRFEAYLSDSGFQTRAELTEVRAEVDADLSRLVDEVLTEELPTPTSALTRVYAETAPDPPWPRAI